ncbi:ribosomal protein L10P [Artemisia annua]|uniref:Ribosomal protein L10P n=1 Tax=Artemisia annua TaxID=35608 RepID=A0A2U1KY84_ARTAN|nr:ribosomal protein L10P [Artemisia annua]
MQGNVGLVFTEGDLKEVSEVVASIRCLTFLQNYKGTVEIITPVDLIQKGDKVGSSEAALLTKLGRKPFSYGLIVQFVYENGSASHVHRPEDLIATAAMHERITNIVELYNDAFVELKDFFNKERKECLHDESQQNVNIAGARIANLHNERRAGSSVVKEERAVAVKKSLLMT